MITRKPREKHITCIQFSFLLLLGVLWKRTHLILRKWYCFPRHWIKNKQTKKHTIFKALLFLGIFPPAFFHLVLYTVCLQSHFNEFASYEQHSIIIRQSPLCLESTRGKKVTELHNRLIIKQCKIKTWTYQLKERQPKKYCEIMHERWK